MSYIFTRDKGLIYSAMTAPQLPLLQNLQVALNCIYISNNSARMAPAPAIYSIFQNICTIRHGFAVMRCFRRVNIIVTQIMYMELNIKFLWMCKSYSPRTSLPSAHLHEYCCSVQNVWKTWVTGIVDCSNSLTHWRQFDFAVTRISHRPRLEYTGD